MPLWDAGSVQYIFRMYISNPGNMSSIMQVIYMAHTRQHDLVQTDHTDHTDQKYVCPAWKISIVNCTALVGIDHTDHLAETCTILSTIPKFSASPITIAWRSCYSGCFCSLSLCRHKIYVPISFRWSLRVCLSFFRPNRLKKNYGWWAFRFFQLLYKKFIGFYLASPSCPNASSEGKPFMLLAARILFVVVVFSLQVSIVMEQTLRLLHQCGMPTEDVDFINCSGGVMHGSDIRTPDTRFWDVYTHGTL